MWLYRGHNVQLFHDSLDEDNVYFGHLKIHSKVSLFFEIFAVNKWNESESLSS
jgi:hypothetical protein